MREHCVERRLAAILALDMVGYSRMMEADETGTLARQKRHRVELIDPKIEAHRGSLIKLTGAGRPLERSALLLAEAQGAAGAMTLDAETSRTLRLALCAT